MCHHVFCPASQQPRPGEEDGVHYNFSDRLVMDQMERDGEFIETAEFSGNMYGTTRAAVEAVTEGGKICILDIDVQVESIRVPWMAAFQKL